MLRCMQSPADQNLNGNGNGMDMSVLEIQRAIFQRLYQNSPQPMQNNVDQLHNIINQNPRMTGDKFEVAQCYNENNFPNLPLYREENFGFAASSSSDIVNSSFTNISNSSQNQGMITANKDKKACTKKRKAEFDIEDCCKDKKIEAGEAKESQSDITVKSERENSNENSKASEVKKPDYIHVRARRGQATDSHSLAERARREKISKKMKYLQELVPGCNKVTGKAGMLDEIINYVQSLQKQVEFLSMKLAALNPRMDYNVDNLFAKELPAYIASFPAATAPLDMVNSTCFSLQQGLPSCGVDMVTNGSQVMPQKRDNSSMAIPEFPQFQQLPTWETNWQSSYSNVNFR